MRRGNAAQVSWIQLLTGTHAIRLFGYRPILKSVISGGCMILNWDVLINVMLALKDNRDFSYLMRTCRSLYDIGIPILLRRGITIGLTTNSILSFCRFINKHPERGPRIHRVLLRGACPRCGGRMGHWKQAFDILAKTIRQCRNITHLEILEEALEFSSNLLESLRSLRRVEEITCTYSIEYCIKLLRTIRSPVTCVKIWFEACMEDFDLRALRDPTVILRNFRDHLTRVYVVFPERIWPPSNLQYTSLLYFGMLSCCPDFHSDDLAVAMPNLKALEWACDETELDVDQAEEMRQDTLDHRDPATHARGWKVLDRLTCSVGRAFSMALTCRVRLWEIMVFGDCETSRLDQFSVVISETRPTHLILNAWYYLLGGICATANTYPSVTHFRLTMKLGHWNPISHEQGTIAIGEILVSTHNCFARDASN